MEKTYLGKGKIGKFDIINFSICLTDIPKEDIQTSGTNGKKYLNLCIGKMKNEDKWGKTHNVWINDYKPEPKPEPTPEPKMTTNEAGIEQDESQLPF